MLAVQESDRTGKLSPVLQRPLSFRGGGASSEGEPETSEELRVVVDHLRARLTDLETENVKLRKLNRELELKGRRTSEAGAPPPLSPELSPTPRQSNDEH